MNYPRNIIAAYASGGIARTQFQKRFGDWQKAQGIDYDCKGAGGRNGAYLTYRSVKATIRGGVICFTAGRANSVFEFRRKVDFAICRRLRGAEWI